MGWAGLGLVPFWPAARLPACAAAHPKSGLRSSWAPTFPLSLASSAARPRPRHSGYKSRGASSRRGSLDVPRTSIDTPRGGRPSADGGGRSAGSSMARESLLSQVSDASEWGLGDKWGLGDN